MYPLLRSVRPIIQLVTCANRGILAACATPRVAERLRYPGKPKDPRIPAEFFHS